MTGADTGPARPARAVIVAVVVLPIVVAVARALARDWFPIGDDALLYIRVRDVFTAHHPLLGSWTSASLSVGTNMNNPGSIYQVLLAPIAHVAGPGPGAAIGVGLANVAAIVGISAASRHIGGWGLQRWMLLACACLSWTMGSELLFDIWQAHALLLPFLAFLVLLVGVAAGRTRCVLWAIFVASVLVQTHISYAYIIATLTPVAVVLAWWDHRPLSRRQVVDRLRSRTAVVALVLVGVLWSQPLIEQLFGEGQGNLARLLSNSGGGDVQLGGRNAAKIVGAVVALPPWWLRRGFSSTVPSTKLTEGPDGPVLVIPSLPGLAVASIAILVVLTAMVLLAVRCRRIGLRLQAHSLVLGAAGTVAAILCLTLLTVGRVGLAAHHVRWVWAFAVFVHAVIAWAVVSLAVVELGASTRAGDRVAPFERWVTPVVLAVTAVLTVLNLPFHAQPEGPVADRAAMPALREVFRGMEAEAEQLRRYAPFVYDTASLRVFEPYSTAVMMELQDMGLEFRVEDQAMIRQLGNRRRASGDETRMYQLEGEAAMFPPPGRCPLVLSGNALDEEEDARLAEVVSALQLPVVGGSVSIDATALSPEDAGLAEAALGGDERSSARVVRSGRLGRWVTSGAAVIDPAALTSAALSRLGPIEDAFALIERNLTTYYAVFIERSDLACD